MTRADDDGLMMVDENRNSFSLHFQFGDEKKGVPGVRWNAYMVMMINESGLCHLQRLPSPNYNFAASLLLLD